jgi:hypothetical protein
MQYANSCNEEKSQLALVKTCSESPKRVSFFLETNHELEGKNIKKYVGWEALLYEKSKASRSGDHIKLQ